MPNVSEGFLRGAEGRRPLRRRNEETHNKSLLFSQEERCHYFICFAVCVKLTARSICGGRVFVGGDALRRPEWQGVGYVEINPPPNRVFGGESGAITCTCSRRRHTIKLRRCPNSLRAKDTDLGFSRPGRAFCEKRRTREKFAPSCANPEGAHGAGKRRGNPPPNRVFGGESGAITCTYNPRPRRGRTRPEGSSSC